MIKLRKHITFLLFGVLVFPILFQSVHIVWHNSQTNKNHYCQKETCDNDSADKTENISQEEDVCQICEYQFSLNDVPNIFIFRPILPEIASTLTGIAAPQQYNQVFSEKSPRAPPVLIS